MSEERDPEDTETLERQREKMLLLSQELRSSRRLCPHCGQPTLERTKLAWYLRPLRLFRPVRAYSCIACGHLSLLSGEDQTNRRRRRKK